MIDGQLSLAEVDLGTIGAKEVSINGDSCSSTSPKGISLVEKYSELGVAETRITKEDEEALIEIEAMHKRVLAPVKKAYIEIKKLYKENDEVKRAFNPMGEVATIYDGADKALLEDVRKLRLRFIMNVVNYIQNKYDVKIDTRPLHIHFHHEAVKHERRPFNPEILYIESYNEILDIILDGLYGKTFKQLSKEQNLEKLKACIKYKDEVQVKNKVIKFPSKVVTTDYSGDPEINYHSNVKIPDFLKLLTFLEDIQEDEAEELIALLGGRNGKKPSADFFKTKDLSKYLNKIEAVRFYKNGKIRIKFSSEVYKDEFYDKFCI